MSLYTWPRVKIAPWKLEVSFSKAVTSLCCSLESSVHIRPNKVGALNLEVNFQVFESG